MMTATELLASCALGVPDCNDTPASVFELPLVIAVLAVLLIVGIASALGLRDPGSSRARRLARRARTQEIRSRRTHVSQYDAAGTPELRS